MCLLTDLLRVLPFGLLRRWFAAADVAYVSTAQQSLAQSLSPTASLSPSELLSSSSSQDNSTIGGGTFGQSQLSPMVVPVPGAMRLPADPLAERALNLLLVLLHNRHTVQPGRPNPFREAFGLLHDQTLQLQQHSTGDLPPNVFGDEEGKSVVVVTVS